MHKRKTITGPEVSVVLAPQLLTIDQVAAALNVGRSTVYGLINEEGLPYILVKGTKRVPVASLDWWIVQKTCSTSAEFHEHIHQHATPLPENERVSRVPYQQKAGGAKKPRPRRRAAQK